MDAVAAHMERLLKRARVSTAQQQQQPLTPAAVLPLTLAAACLARHPPPPLARLLSGSASALVSLSDPARTPPEALGHKLRRELDGASARSDGAERVFDATRALLVYVRTVRGVLAAVNSHLQRRTLDGGDGACLDIISAVLRELSAVCEPESEAREPPPKALKTARQAPRRASSRSDESPSAVPRVLATADAAGVVSRALGRDAGDGAAVLAAMASFPQDERVQTHGVRAVKGVVRSLLQSERPSGGDDEAGADADADADAPVRRLVAAVTDRMTRFPSTLKLQRDGLQCLRDVAAAGELRVVTSLGGVAAIVSALSRLPDDLEANAAGLAVLAHPAIADASTLRVDPESRRLALSAMRRFPLDEQIQGLGALALGNLSLRHDASRVDIVANGGLQVAVAAMKRFAGAPMVQAAGCRLVAIASSADEASSEACLEAGALPAAEKARVRFHGDPKVQQYALEAIRGLAPPAPGDAATLETRGGDGDATCAVQ